MKANKQYFLKESVILAKYCKAAGCKNYLYRPKKDAWRTRLGFCYEHYSAYLKEWHRKVRVPWLKKQSKEKRSKIKKDAYVVWKKWVTNNLERRREIARKAQVKIRRRYKRRKLYMRSKSSTA